MINGLTPEQAAQWAERAGIPLRPGREEIAAAVADGLQESIASLREVDFGDMPAAGAFDATT
ncbi:hypothetical protein D5S17_16535 [Pseudonocardiaceae bacterium YIM PH 21723]|nr:hypothetical protein D5S17_16535 [Pseudonocardiaceae bacterium YIM PH 21723]